MGRRKKTEPVDPARKAVEAGREDRIMRSDDPSMVKPGPRAATTTASVIAHPQPSPQRPGFSHGPPSPSKMPFGVAHLRHAMGLSDREDLERLAEDAALEIERLRMSKPFRTPFKQRMEP